jgi:hypothetical protein
MAANSPPDGGGYESENKFNSLGEAEAGEVINTTTRKSRKQKRTKYTPWEFSPTLFDDSPKQHEGKYLVVETTSGAKLTDLSVFTVEAVLRFIAPNYVSADKLRDGKMLILTKDARSAKHAMTITEVKGVCNVKVTDHNDLNYVKASVYCEEIMNERLEDIKEQLKSQNVTDVARITRMERGKAVDTPLHILTFNSSKLEETVKIGWKVLKLRKYYPSPLKCTKCLIYGHTKKNCPEANEFCRGCAMVRHEGECTRVGCRSCPNADPPHKSGDETCPKLNEEKAIIQIKEDMKIPYFRARLEFEKRVEKAAKTAETQQKIQEQQDMYRNRTFAQITTQDNVQQQILGMLEKLQKKIENLEKNQFANKATTTVQKRKRHTSVSHVNSSADDTDIDLITHTPTNQVEKQSQQQQETQTEKHHTDNTISDSNNNHDDVEMIVSDTDNAVGLSLAGESTDVAVTTGNAQFISEARFMEFKELSQTFESIQQKVHATRQQTQQQLDQPTTKIEFDKNNKPVKRLQSATKKSSIDGKPKK